MSPNTIRVIKDSCEEPLRIHADSVNVDLKTGLSPEEKQAIIGAYDG